jgi:hypothetical protein
MIREQSESVEEHPIATDTCSTSTIFFALISLIVFRHAAAINCLGSRVRVRLGSVPD